MTTSLAVAPLFVPKIRTSKTKAEMGTTHHRVCPHRGAPPLERRPLRSSNFRNRIARQTPEYEPPPTPPDFQVAGPLAPTINGAYYETGINEGKPYYRRSPDEPWYIWYTKFDAWHRWYITQTLADRSTFRWHRKSVGYEPPPGSFDPHGGSAGQATVTAI